MTQNQDPIFTTLNNKSECDNNTDCCVFEGFYFMLCTDASRCISAGGRWQCSDDPVGECHFTGDTSPAYPDDTSIVGPCDSVSYPFPPGSQGWFNYDGPFSKAFQVCQTTGPQAGNCIYNGYCCDNECSRLPCSS